MRDKFRRMPSWHNFGLQLYIERKQDFVTLLRFIRRPGVKGGINNGAISCGAGMGRLALCL